MQLATDLSAMGCLLRSTHNTKSFWILLYHEILSFLLLKAAYHLRLAWLRQFLACQRKRYARWMLIMNAMKMMRILLLCTVIVLHHRYWEHLSSHKRVLIGDCLNLRVRLISERITRWVTSIKNKRGITIIVVVVAIWMRRMEEIPVFRVPWTYLGSRS